MRSDKAARSWPGGRSREQLAQAEPAVTAEQTARNPRSDVVGPPIVAEVVLVDIPMKELQRNLMMDAEDRPLERSEISLGRVDVNPDAVSGSGELLGRVIDAIVTAHLAAEPVVNGKLVGAENAGAVEPAEHQWIKSHTAGGGNNGCTRVATALDRGEDHRVVGAAPRAAGMLLPVARLTADIGFISLNETRQVQLLAAFQHGAQAMQQMPTRPVLHPEMMVQAHCTDRLGSVQDQKHRDVPEPQWQVRSLHRGADRDRELFAAGTAAIEARTRRDRGCLIDRAAPGADWPLGPAEAFHVRPTGFIGVEFPQERRQFHSQILADCVSKSNRSPVF